MFLAATKQLYEWLSLSVRPSVYDKRDAFKFEIINYPDLSGNISTKPAYGVFTSQVIRYARICSKKNDLLERVKSLTKKTTMETLHHQWPQVITEEISEETSLDHDQNGPKTSPEPHRRITEPHRRITINILGILELPNYYLSLLLGIPEHFYLLHKQASRCTIGWSDFGCWGANTS